jgi:hypothetical protein
MTKKSIYLKNKKYVRIKNKNSMGHISNTYMILSMGHI